MLKQRTNFSRFLWDLLIRGYAKIILLFSGKLKEAESLYTQMIGTDWIPSEEILVSMLALYGRNDKLETALDLFERNRADGVAPSNVLYNTVIDACIKCRRLDHASRLFEEMDNLGVGYDHVTYSSMIHAYTKEG